MHFHHVAYNVKEISEAISQWEKIGAVKEGEICEIKAHSVRVQFLQLAGVRIELVEGKSANHICYICDDIEEKIAKAREEGGLVVKPPVPSEAFEGRLMCFIYYNNIGLIEWVNKSITHDLKGSGLVAN